MPLLRRPLILSRSRPPTPRSFSHLICPFASRRQARSHALALSRSPCLPGWAVTKQKTNRSRRSSPRHRRHRHRRRHSCSDFTPPRRSSSPPDRPALSLSSLHVRPLFSFSLLFLPCSLCSLFSLLSFLFDLAPFSVSSLLSRSLFSLRFLSNLSPLFSPFSLLSISLISRVPFLSPLSM